MCDGLRDRGARPTTHGRGGNSERFAVPDACSGCAVGGGLPLHLRRCPMRDAGERRTQRNLSISPAPIVNGSRKPCIIGNRNRIVRPLARSPKHGVGGEDPGLSRFRRCLCIGVVRLRHDRPAPGAARLRPGGKRAARAPGHAGRAAVSGPAAAVGLGARLFHRSRTRMPTMISSPRDRQASRR